MAQRIKRVIDTLPYAEYRTVAWLLGENKKTVQRIFQIRGWRVWKRKSGSRPRVQSLPSAATSPNERWATEMARVWFSMTPAMDCFTRELLGWQLSPTGNARAAEAALEEALNSRYGILGRALDDLTIRSDNGLVFTSRRYTRTVYRYGIKKEFIRPHTPQQNGMMERLIRSVKERYLWLHNFASLDEARQALGAWFRYYNEQRPHQALGMKTPRETYNLAA
ncbi:integrase core domain-containing protein [Pseudohalioglobus sediminis]|uniref:integrase core domain-containing protein n=1 Tax=Pseudohalioglobus sediminis TaxID=2606449 RepID=UPI001CB6D9A5|nr:integrase core domain-containing protein [Pseudohalioglobus sediminis]